MNHDPTNFFRYARERYRILLRQRGELTSRGNWTEALSRSGCWTCDHILQQYRFCNVFREDDKTTIWIRDHVREPLRDDPSVLLAMVVARWFNRISTLEILLEAGLFQDWNTRRAQELLKDVHPLVTAAYMVKTPAGASKLDGLLWCIDQFRLLCGPVFLGKDHGSIPAGYEFLTWAQRGGCCTLQAATEMLTKSPYLGPFMAYEIVTDLRHTSLLDRAPDIMTWANPGPGATRGAGRILYDSATYLRRSRPDDVEEIMDLMQGLLTMSQDPEYWPAGWPSWEMREVEHTLCEFDKYERVRLGEGTPKQLYRGANT